MATGGRRGKAGGFSVARLRRWLLAGVIGLLLGLAGLIGYTHWKTRKLLMDLPRRLGADIKSVTDGFTWSQSVKGHTIFTIHASKAIQRENGKTTLHDVAITLYGAPGTNRTDQISGAEFEYDQSNGIVRAAGEVHLDLAAPTPAVNSVSDVKSALQSSIVDAAHPDSSKLPDPSKRIRVTTSGLTFLQKLGTAETDQPLQIIYGDMHGSATGADYQSNTGLLNLHSAVEMNGTQNRQRVHLRAAAAEMDRASQRATLHGAHITTDDNQASGDLMVVGLAKTGGIESVHAEGHATLESKGGMVAHAPRMDAQMGDAGKLRGVLMQGGVQFGDASGTTGKAARTTVHFDAAGQATSAEFDGAVQLDQLASSGQRTITGAHLVTQLMKDAARHTALRDATATGSALLRTSDVVAARADRPQATQVTTLRGNRLHAQTAQHNGVAYVSELTASGDTQLVQDDGLGTVRTSSGDDLHAVLAAPSAKGKEKNIATNSDAAGQVQSAIQTGHVVVVEHTPAKASQPAGETRATGARAEFESATGALTLTGSPQVTSPVMQLAGDRIVLQQGSGAAEATGAVRGVYLAAAAADKAEQKRPADPVHLLADHATVSSGGASAKLYGTPGKMARMWTSTAQIEAPLIETERATGKLFAHAADSETGTVHLVLPVQASQGKSAPATAGAVRVTGSTLVYTPADARGPAHADVAGGVRINSPGSQLTARSAVATMSAAAPAAKGTGSLLTGGAIQSITATGDVRLQQPGRSGMGERLVYTAADQRYVLTGTPSAPPRIQDSQRGTVSGALLVFHGTDDSIDVSAEEGHRVRTETEVAKPARGR
jgi:lipopolysaccharide export system protein LptA